MTKNDIDKQYIICKCEQIEKIKYSRDPNQNGKIQTSDRGVFRILFFHISYWDSQTHYRLLV